MGVPEDGAHRGFEIIVEGAVDPTVRARLDDVEIEVVGDRTVIRDQFGDQAALFGLLQRLQELELEVIDVHHTGGPGA
jgi:hypothetical protein